MGQPESGGYIVYTLDINSKLFRFVFGGQKIKEEFLMETRKKSFKKKALLSSLSMLMVATVAVGSATFAWFTNNKSVTADGMKVQAAAATGLQITGNNGGTWGAKYTFNDGTTGRVLSPISIGYTTDNALAGSLSTPYYPVKAGVDGPKTSANADNFETWTASSVPAAATSTEADASNDNGYIAIYEVGIRSTNADIPNVKCKLTFDEEKPFTRIALVEQAGSAYNAATDKLIYVYGSQETIYDAEQGQEVTATPTAITDTNGTVTNQIQPTASGTEYELTSSVTTSPKYYSIIVWYEGQDNQCIDANQQAIGDISINFYYV
ncbi:MAG: hypothetical protein ACI4RP_07535 [Acutalibacteraceae bacterium]